MWTKSRCGIVVLGALSLPMAHAGEWGKEKDDFVKDCSSVFKGFASVGSCAGFLFNSGKPLRLMIPQSVVPGGGTALGLTYVEPVNLTDWAGSNFTLDGGSSLRQFWFGSAVLTLSH